MTFNNQGAYTQNAGISGFPYIELEQRDPTVNDVQGKFGYFKITQLWVNQSSKVVWMLFDLSNATGELKASWRIIGALFGDVDSLTGDDLVVIPPDGFGNINIDGAVVANATNPKAVYTKNTSANTMQIQTQLAAAIASTDVTKVGLAAFNSSEFTVDANGFVNLLGGSPAIEKINLQTGTSPIVPSSGAITLNGAVVAAGTNPIRTDGTGANTGAIEVQISQAIAATDATKIGLANFDSAAFDVDANGFVQLNGGGIAATSFGVDANTAPGTNPVVPTAAGLVTITGGQVAAGTTVNAIRTDSLAANTYTIQIQRSQAVASTTIGDNGISHFDSAKFTCDANGFVSLSGTGAISTITGNTGGAESPSAGNFNILGTGSITVAGSANTETVQLTGLTNHAVLVGAGTATITNIAATANTGAVLQNNSGADPSYSTATYPSTTTIDQILYSSAANTVTGLATANRAVLTTGTTGVPVLTALAADGQLIIGSTAGVPAANTLTAGVGISITNGSNSITIATSGSGFAWSDQSGAFAAVKANGYFITATSTATLPASPSEGDAIAFIVDTTQILTIQANTGQLIRAGTTVSAAAGTCVSNFRGDSIELVYRATGTTWFSLSAPEGTWTIT